MRVLDAIWLIEPTYSHGHFVLNWIGTFAWQLQKRPLLPINDPQLEEALVAHGAH
jgi:hypothetical protein